jgi:hypothetical protein
LAETTYDRRYIALARRFKALRGTGDHEAAFRDVAAIIATPDITVEQKRRPAFSARDGSSPMAPSLTQRRT